MVTTLYKCIKSRKLTAAADKNRLTPVENKSTYKSGNTARSTVGVTRERVATITITRAIMEDSRLTPLDITLVIGNRYFGTYTFLMRSALPIMDVSATMDDGAHSDTGRFIKEVEDDLAAQQIYREILHISVTGEKVGKYNRQYCHHQKRIQHRPKKSQHRAPVFGFDIPLDQLVNEGSVFDKDTNQAHGGILSESRG